MDKPTHHNFKNQLIDQVEIARHLRVSLRTLRRWERRGLLPKPILSQGGVHRWSLQDLQGRFGEVFA